jgi:threonine synthase
VIAGCRRTGGTGYLVDDDEVLAAQRRLAREEGIFCEPAGAVAVAAAIKAMASGDIGREAVVVCLITGSAFKDQPSLDQMANGPTHTTIELKEVTDWLNN